MKIKSYTLIDALKKENIDIKKYDSLVLDTQGSEMLILKGLIPIINNFKYIRTETWEIEAYEGAAFHKDISKLLLNNNFTEHYRQNFYKKLKVPYGSDTLFKKKIIKEKT